MPMRGENWRFWIPVAVLAGFAVYSSQKLVRCHIDPQVDAPDYLFKKTIPIVGGALRKRRRLKDEYDEKEKEQPDLYAHIHDPLN